MLNPLGALSCPTGTLSAAAASGGAGTGASFAAAALPSGRPINGEPGGSAAGGAAAGAGLLPCCATAVLASSIKATATRGPPVLLPIMTSLPLTESRLLGFLIAIVGYFACGVQSPFWHLVRGVALAVGDAIDRAVVIVRDQQRAVLHRLHVDRPADIGVVLQEAGQKRLLRFHRAVLVQINDDEVAADLVRLVP